MEAATQPQASAKPPAHMLNEVGNFIRQYLVCSDQQAALLAVWVLHAWCYRAFPVTPYLNIQSPGPQSGKTLCLRPIVCTPYNADFDGDDEHEVAASPLQTIFKQLGLEIQPY